MDNKPVSVVERINILERRQEGLDKSLDLTLNQVRGTLASAMEVLDATVGVLSELNLVEDLPGKVQAKIESNRAARKASQIAQARTERKALVDNGVLAVAEEVSLESVMVVKVTNAEGQIVGPDEQAIEFSQVHEHLRSNFLGQKVGFTFEAGPAEKIEILEIYNVIDQSEKKAEAAPAPLAEVVNFPKA